jgi:hypothetical protein
MSGQHPSQSFRTLPFAQPTHCRRYDGIEIEMTSLMSSGQKRLEAALLGIVISPARRSAWLTMGLDDHPERWTQLLRPFLPNLTLCATTTKDGSIG